MCYCLHGADWLPITAAEDHVSGIHTARLCPFACREEFSHFQNADHISSHPWPASSKMLRCHALSRISRAGLVAVSHLDKNAVQIFGLSAILHVLVPGGGVDEPSQNGGFAPRREDTVRIVHVLLAEVRLAAAVGVVSAELAPHLVASQVPAATPPPSLSTSLCSLVELRGLVACFGRASGSPSTRERRFLSTPSSSPSCFLGSCCCHCLHF